MRKALVVLVVLGLGWLALWSILRARAADAAADQGAEAGALAMERLRGVLASSAPAPAEGDAATLVDARAWVREHRPAGWAYGELEARMLADFVARAHAQRRPASWGLEKARRELDTIRALDADLDGRVSEDEAVAMVGAIALMLDPEHHPYLVGLLDGDGDGRVDDDAMWAVGADEAERAGLAERARADRWDTDNDGLLSEEERAAGLDAERAHHVVFEDGHIEYTDTPPVDPEEVRGAVLDRIAEQFGAESAGMARARLDSAVDFNLAESLARAMALVERDTGGGGGHIPEHPDFTEFDDDGDGVLNEQQSAAFEGARLGWEVAYREWEARTRVAQLSRQFESLAAAGDTDGDGLMNEVEWENLIAARVGERDHALVLRSYDMDGSGRIDAAEVGVFLDWFRAGSIRADVNYDGRLDARDLEAMVEHYRGEGS